MSYKGLGRAGRKGLRRLDVPMDDPFRMRGILGLGNLNGEVEQSIRL